MKVMETVEDLLKHEPELRDSDKRLLLMYWAREGLQFTEEQKRIFMNATTAETITRARRALRAKYPGTEKIEDERYKKYLEHKHIKSIAMGLW